MINNVNIYPYLCKNNDLIISKNSSERSRIFLISMIFPMFLFACNGANKKLETTSCNPSMEIENERTKGFDQDPGIYNAEYIEGREDENFFQDSMKNTDKTFTQYPSQTSSLEAEKETPPPCFKRTSDIIFQNEKINQERFVGRVKEGDLVKVEIISGIQKETQFSDFYDVAIETIQKNYYCEGPSKFNSSERCGYIYEEEQCMTSRRDYLGESETSIDMDEYTDSVDLVLRIGDQDYKFEEIQHFVDLNHDSHLSASLKITRNMLRGINELYLKPLNESKGEVKVGFQSYIYCPNKYAKDFRFEKTTSSTTIPHKITREFELTLKILSQEVMKETE